MNAARYLLATIGLLGLTACGGDLLQSKVAQPQIYVLRPTTVTATDITIPIHMAIALPTTAPGLDSTRIASLRTSNQLDFFYGVRWGGTVPELVQAFMVTLMQNQHSLSSVATEQAHTNTEYLLDIEVHDFQAEYLTHASPQVRVSLIAHLVRIKDRHTVTQLQASSVQIATENSMRAVIAAFQTALQQTSLTLAEQVTAQLTSMQ